MTLRILTVCSGNICRSPLAAQLLETGLSEDFFEVQSAGTTALVGERMPEPAQDIASVLGLRDYQKHQGKQLLVDDVARADLVLAMSREHRRAVVELHPPAVRYAFTLTEFAHIAEKIPKNDFIELVRRASAPEHGALNAISRLRGMVPPLGSTEDLDIEDPYRRSVAIYQRSSSNIADAVNTIVQYFDDAIRLRPE